MSIVVASRLLHVASCLPFAFKCGLLLICDVGQICGQIMSLFVPFLAKAPYSFTATAVSVDSSSMINSMHLELSSDCLSRSMSIGLLMAANGGVEATGAAVKSS